MILGGELEDAGYVLIVTIKRIMSQYDGGIRCRILYRGENGTYKAMGGDGRHGVRPHISGVPI